jgi:hypothetical protein
MSSQSDYQFQPASTSDSVSLQLPFALLTAAIAILLVAQTLNIFKARTALNDGIVQLNEAYRNREPLVKQSADVQHNLEAIVLDLLILAKTDEEAAKIVQKNGIQQTGAAAGSETTPAAKKD